MSSCSICQTELSTFTVYIVFVSFYTCLFLAMFPGNQIQSLIYLMLDYKEKSLARSYTLKTLINNHTPDFQSKPDKDTLPFRGFCRHQQYKG